MQYASRSHMDAQEREQLVAGFSPLISAISRNITQSNDTADLQQEGVVALLKCLKTWNPRKGTLRNYARGKILWAMIEWRDRNPRERTLITEEWVPLEVADPGPLPDEVLAKAERTAHLNRAIDTLLPRRRKLVGLYLAGCDSREVAHEMKITPRSASATYRRSIAALRIAYGIQV